MKNSIIAVYLQLNFLIMWPTIHKASVPLRSFEEYIIWYCQKNIIKRTHVNYIYFLIQHFFLFFFLMIISHLKYSWGKSRTYIIPKGRFQHNPWYTDRIHSKKAQWGHTNRTPHYCRISLISIGPYPHIISYRVRLCGSNNSEHRTRSSTHLQKYWDKKKKKFKLVTRSKTFW